MKKALSVLTMTAVVFLAISVFAQNKVVVIPLGSNSASSASGDSWIRVYDTADTFIGYVLYQQSTNPPIGIINDKNYFTGLRPNGGAASGFGTSSTAIYTDSNCSGNPYIDIEESGSNFLFGGARPGTVSRPFSEDTVYYIPLNAAVVDLGAGTYYDKSNGPCQSLEPPKDNPWKAYTLLPNDPVVTGFQDSYTGPLKAVYTLPASP